MEVDFSVKGKQRFVLTVEFELCILRIMANIKPHKGKCPAICFFTPVFLSVKVNKRTGVTFYPSILIPYVKKRGKR